MTHMMDMSLSVLGWSVDPELLADLRVEISHSEMFGDVLRAKLMFKTGREVMIEGSFRDGTGREVYEAIHAEIMRPTKKVIDAEGET